ncbi:hypothetical protein [Paenibacillus aceris]|uniref:Uncharacterized protein n=1 Tax=Paenibacillus aceris TaxID=869555 RepID=A0ABS4HUY8_9BACL|nr:hypothetical protein [Paenibacillus aceris]MBP1962452.1 hypothetical protein [Paenibacillus aceris]NHW37266.1 hypothetical protein [Paenibacillus aceris]
MAWINMLEREQLTVKLDNKDEMALLEVNDGGISPNYVTIRLNENEIDELIEALQRIKQAIQ